MPDASTDGFTLFLIRIDEGNYIPFQYKDISRALMSQRWRGTSAKGAYMQILKASKQRESLSVCSSVAVSTRSQMHLHFRQLALRVEGLCVDLRCNNVFEEARACAYERICS